MSHRDFNRGPDSYRRRRPTLEPRRTFLIVTEGEKTEPSYFRALRDRLRLTNVEVNVYHPEATDPKSLTEAAIQLGRQRESKARKGDGVAYDEVWVVYDLEKTNDERRRLHKGQYDRQKASGIHAATSDPSFEYWLLLHFQYTTSPFPDCKAVIRHLKRHLPGYEKASTISDALLDRTAVAIKHAEQCRQHHRGCGGSGNPSTRVDILVQNLNSVAAAPHRFLVAARK